ncbi:uncharacterized protein PITG_01403 [Phytophthora infestans T30-4]|uniref:C2 domain-containing protein n=1 Tax=Phytophthora infestans (strain T30-4) TaxID=403677 RepID=D0MT57_PHYIT|nr:uncharacterized protein PITG_01403 [Phytophthora infestans T30-4]EEY61154.1 conserved hypothetical protein [Phytophthora infestans T30-4]|eukprot:XP_002908071.1 conserved hypothetical protein [Phytophthora infestans T30-4]
MSMLLPKKIMSARSSAEPDPKALPLALIKKKSPLLPSLSARSPFASCASMTKSFLSRAFPSPNKKLWKSQSSPTGVDDHTDSSMASDEQDDEAARGEICEIIVKSSIWGSAKWSQGQLQLPHRLACTVRSGAATKASSQPERCDNEFTFDEKFVFERRENDAQYHDVTIEVSAVAPGFGRKHRLGQVAVDLDAAFAQASGPIYERCNLTMADGSDSGVEIHYVLHRLEVQNATAAAASRVLTRSSTSLNDDDDMDACGQIFPDLWYLC